jgi:ribosomal protein L7/L12
LSITQYQNEALDPSTSAERLWELAVSRYDPETVDLLLISIANNKKIAVIKALKSISRASLYTVKKWTDNVPCFINRQGIQRAAAESIRTEVIAAGAVIELQAKVIPGEYAIWVVQNPSTPVELLWALGSCEDAELRRLVLQHPLLPIPLLYLLGTEFPEIFLQNPVVQLAMLEDPEVFFRWPERVQAALLTLPNISAALLRHVIIHSSSNLRSTALKHPEISAQILAELSSQGAIDLRADIAANPKTSNETLARLAQDHVDVVRGAVARNPNTPIELLRQLSQEKEPNKGYVIQNPSTPIELLLEIAQSNSQHALYSLKNNKVIPSSSLRTLSQNGAVSARLAAAAHPNSSPELLDELSDDSNLDVLCAVAQNPATSAGTLEKLAATNQYRLVESVASNPNLPSSLLQKITQEYQEREEWVILLVVLAQNPALPEEFCFRYLPSLQIAARRTMALHNKHAAVLAALSHDSSREVRIAIAQNPNTSQEILAALENDPEPAVKQQAAARHQNIEWSN